MTESPQKPKRKYVSSKFMELADIVDLCVRNLKNTVKALENPDTISEAVKSVFDAETEGDLVRDVLLESFSLEKHPPIIQLDRVDLMQRLDKIMNKCEHAARQIELAGLFFPLNELPALLEIMELVATTAKMVTNGVRVVFDSFEEAVDKIKDVEDVRDQSRDLMYALTAKVLKDPATNHQALFATDKITLRVEQVAERAKEAADLLANMKLKYV